VSFQSAGEIAARQTAADDAAAKAAALAAEAVRSQLLSFLQSRKTEAVTARDTTGVTDMLQESARRRRGEHSAQRAAQLAKYKMPNYWVPLTQTKSIHTEAWFRDLLMPYNDKIWMLEPTVLPELQEDEKEEVRQEIAEQIGMVEEAGMSLSPTDIQQVHDEVMDAEEKETEELAKKCAKEMEKLIQDQHEECDFRSVFREFQSNLVTYGTAFLKGPFVIKRKMPRWEGGKRVVTDRLIPACSAPSPLDIYPAPWANNEQEGYIIERIPTYREALNAMRGMEYCQTPQIEALLKRTIPPSPSAIPEQGTRQAHEDKIQTPPKEAPFEVWSWTGPIPGYMLTEWGLANIDEASDYLVEVLWCDTFILKVVPRWDEVWIRPYFGARFKALPGSFWGRGVPLLMSASQDRANAAMIALIDNMQWASGPGGWIDQSRLVNPNDIADWHPRKLLAIQSQAGQNGVPMGFFDIQMRVAELQALYQRCCEDADNESGVPAYMYGSGQIGGAGGTYSGLSTLMNAAARGIKDALLEVDKMLSKFIQHWADWNNEYSDDERVKGDVRVVCSGASGLFVQEMQLSRMDDLIAQSTQLAQFTGPRFIINLLRQKAKILRVSTDGLPTEEDLQRVPQQTPQDLLAATAEGGEQPSGEAPTGEPGVPAAKQPGMGVGTGAVQRVTPIQKQGKVGVQ